MNSNTDSHFDLDHLLHELKHYLPAQAPLKDFIHHNTLHAFQKQRFHDGLRFASEVFGYKISLTLDEYRGMYRKGTINKEIMRRAVVEMLGEAQRHDQQGDHAARRRGNEGRGAS